MARRAHLALVLCSALVLGACAPRDQKLTDRKPGRPGGDGATVTKGGLAGGDAGLVRSSAMTLLEVARLLDKAMDVKSRIGVPIGPNGMSEVKELKNACGIPKVFKTAHASLERFELISSECFDDTATMRASKKGSESFVVVYPSALPSVEELKTNPELALPFPHTITMDTLALGYNFSSASQQKDTATVRVFGTLSASLVEENQTQVVYEVSGKLQSNFEVNLYTTFDTGFMAVNLDNVRVVVDKTTRKTVAIGGAGTKVSRFMRGDRYNKTKKGDLLPVDPAAAEAAKADPKKGGFYLMKDDNQIGGQGEAVIAEPFALGVDSCQMPKLGLRFKKDDIETDVSIEGLQLCKKDGKPGFSYLYEGLFFGAK